MRILLTNDDGIDAPGLAALERIVAAWQPEAEVWTVAPALEQSGVGHALTYIHPLRYHRLSDRRASVEGTPADCVIAALHHLLPERPDLVLSGVNMGNNSAENSFYSGTLGAALEGALQGVKSIALSAFLGPDNMKTGAPFEATEAYAADVLTRIMELWPEQSGPYPLFWNVNFPPVLAADVKGVRLAAQGMREGASFAVKAETSPTGRKFLWTHGGDQRRHSAPGTDADVNLDGYVSVTPMRADWTDHALLQELTW